MVDAGPEPAFRPRTEPPRLGLLVNPIAGMGGPVGLKGTDGAETLAEAIARGAMPRANERAEIAIRSFVADRLAPISVLAAPGQMGADAVARAGATPVLVGALGDRGTSAADTVRLIVALADAGAELILFAGGDGTARDIAAALGDRPQAVLGIPAGVKIQSSVFATSPAAAGQAAAAFLALPAARRRTTPREVLDLDEDAYRRGEIAPRLFAELRVPGDRAVQARKSPSPASETAAARAIADEVVARLGPGRTLILGPGSTVRAVAERLGVPKTLVGVDVVEIGPDGAARLVHSDADETGLGRATDSAPQGSLAVVVTPIGGQGFLFGRGNQQIGPGVLRAILDRTGRNGIIVIAAPAKLAALGGRPLLVDTGDAGLDARLEGYMSVVTGRSERSVYPVRRA